MKKMLLMGLSSFVIFAAIPVFAAEAQPVCGIGNCNVGECFMDSDCDGICGDHVFTDENGDGICDYHCYTDENADSVCDYFIDSDADGVCDHCHEHGKPQQTYCAPQNQQNQNMQQQNSGHHGSSHHGRSGHHRGHC